MNRYIWTLALCAACDVRAESPQRVLALLADPIADLARLDAELDSDYKLGPEQAGSRETLTLHSTFPLHLTPQWNILADTRIPFIAQDRVAEGWGEQQGIGDIEQALYAVPVWAGRADVTLGMGGLVRLGTASSDALGAAAWGAGPSLALVQHEEQLISGLVFSHVWGDGGTDTSTVEGFTTWLGSHHSSEFRLEADYDHRTRTTTVPVNVNVSWLTRSGVTFVNVTAGARYYVDVPRNLGPWGLHLAITLVRDKQ